MDRISRNMRAAALQKLAELSTAGSRNIDSLNRLENVLPSAASEGVAHEKQVNGQPNGVSMAQTPMTVKELQVLLALCKAAPRISDGIAADKLCQRLSSYILECHEQQIEASPYAQTLEPPPWEALSYALVSAVLTLALRHQSLRGRVSALLLRYLDNCGAMAQQIVASEAQADGTSMQLLGSAGPTARIILAMSILGFLRASAAYADFYTEDQRLKLIRSIRRILSNGFLVALEGALSSFRNSESTLRSATELHTIVRRYAAEGRPLGAMLLQQAFSCFLVSSSALQVANAGILEKKSILDYLVDRPYPQVAITDIGTELAEQSFDIAHDMLQMLDEGVSYLQLGSPWQQQLAAHLRANALTVSLSTLLLEDSPDPEILLSWLETSVADPIQMAHQELAIVVLKCLMVLAKTSPVVATTLSRSLPRCIVHGCFLGSALDVAAECLAAILMTISQDAVVTGLYSLGNMLSSSSADQALASATTPRPASMIRETPRFTHHTGGSSLSLELDTQEDSTITYVNIVRAIVSMAVACDEERITSLAQSMLVQKLGRINAAVDSQITIETARLGGSGSENDITALFKLYDRLAKDAITKKIQTLTEAVDSARAKLAEILSANPPWRQLYQMHILETIISRGDVHERDGQDTETAAKEIGQLLHPLAVLAPATADSRAEEDNDALRLERDVWYNIAVQGILPGSDLWIQYEADLHVLARYSRPLIAEDRTEHLESDLEINTLLRRGMSAKRTVEVKSLLTKFIPSQESGIRSLEYPKVIFLLAVYAVETLRAETGHCADMLSYFIDPSVNQRDVSPCMNAIADQVVGIFLSRALTGLHPDCSAPLVAVELARVLTACCHRVLPCQQMAFSFADRIIAQMPSALAQKDSLFALLELLNLMWLSCMDRDADEYEWKSSYSSRIAHVKIELSDDFEFRQRTLRALLTRARSWVLQILNVAPWDVKGLLQTYLSSFSDDGSLGHVSLGRSFALEIGSAVSSADQRLTALRHLQETDLNESSDFMAQYTTRQEYKYAEALPVHGQGWINLTQRDKDQELSKKIKSLLTIENNGTSLASKMDRDIRDSQSVLEALSRRIEESKYVPVGELRDILRRAASLLCRSYHEGAAIIHQLVAIPFALLTKESIKLGLSIWLGVINEIPHLEPRFLAEISQAWDISVRKKVGAFDPRLQFKDPFFLKEEFAPSDQAAVVRRRQLLNSIIAPHFQVLRFLSSHFNAYRLSSPHLRRCFQRVVRITLDGLRQSVGNPLARQFHFEVILFGLSILRYSDDFGKLAKWRLKDRLLSAALAWFAHPPRWTFGGNRIQVRAECQLMQEVESALQKTADIGSEAIASVKSLQSKQDLLVKLLQNELARLDVWLSPMTPDISLTGPKGDKAILSALSPETITVAWSESPELAVEIAVRSQAAPLIQAVKRCIASHTDQCIGYANALQLFFAEDFPTDAFDILKYLLYWAPVNPCTAATLFLPQYQHNPFVIQYAMRSLESHAVDITFFYVPQIVQTLRYDALGYVERYIVETAKMSQLFAHQIIWNMKANSYKDEDATEEDSLKPTLDRVMDKMIAGFSGPDKTFYDREFSFFNAVTSISGKLKPYIKRSKAEKKQKIEEELRNIKLEVGVYLPSNPDGVVIGIDRKSGKPLQSHAKAPFMATFRIRRSKGSMEDTEQMLEQTVERQGTERAGSIGGADPNTYDVWQSAIFKVGDDCRQDVLALQMIAAFRGIFASVGLDVFVYPYRVTATAPGCGVIDVLPNSISRDQLGREAVNGLLDYFKSKYGSEDSIRFQEARSNFVKSMAAYSIISFLLQFKDRHNGNIMIDDQGHIEHIDFGFCFDIAPGGVRFERAPFKLTGEMVAVMGGSTTSQSYRWFEELCIKAFLAVRPYAQQLADLVVLMLDSGLPCFKPPTVKHFMQRFVLDRSEREAAEFVKGLIDKSCKAASTAGYDWFQLQTNGIPY